MIALDSGALGGIWGSLATGAATALGAVPILGMGRLTARREAVLLGFAAGVMLSASFFSLLAPALAHALAGGYSRVGASLLIACALVAGAALLEALNALLPVHEHAAADHVLAPQNRSVCLLVLAITLHNIPEGAAVGMSFVGGKGAGLSTTIGIGVQDLPEGFAVASALAAIGWSRGLAFAGGAASGLVEPAAGAASAVFVASARGALPWGLGAAAGAMLMIVIGQIIPETICGSERRPALMAFFGGLGLMMVLDTALG